MKNFKNIAVLSFIAMALACSKSDDNANQVQPGAGGWASFAAGGRETSVEVITAERGFIADQVRSFGTVQAQQLVTVTPQVSNRVTELYADLGDEVKKGQALAKIYDVTLKDLYNQAKAQVGQSRVALERDSTQLDRQEQVLDKKLIAQSEFDVTFATYQNASAQYESALAQLTQAEENLANTIIRSPASGVIVSRTIEVGDLATTGQPAFEINSDIGYQTRLFLPVQDWKVVNIGQEVSLRASNEAEATVTGVVSRKSPRLDPTTGLGEVIVTLNSTGESIFAGVLTETSINIQVKPQALIVPRGALVEKVETVVEPESNTIQLKKSYSVFVAQGDTMAVQRPLTLGIEQGDKIEVLSGLSAGDKIIVTGQQGLRNRAKIKVATGENFITPDELKIANQENGGNRGGWDASQRPGQGSTAQQTDSTNTGGENTGVRAGNRQGRQGGNQLFASLSEDEQQKIRTKMQGMSPEERRKYMTALRDSVQQANSSGN